jgi:hypothetical protein
MCGTFLPSNRSEFGEGSLEPLSAVRLSSPSKPHGEAMKILRVDGSKKTFQHNPISMRCRARYANNCRGSERLTPLSLLEFFIL